jgi:hypothetical protein
MATLTITTRRTRKGGKRFVVRYRLGGRYFPIQHGGSFKTMKEARARRDFIAGELAHGRNPLESLRVAEEPSRTVAQVYRDFRKSRLDVSEGTLRNFDSHWKLFEADFGAQAPERITHTDVQEWVSASKLAPATLRVYLGTLRQILDFAGVEPNPVRDKRVKLPMPSRRL